MERIEQVVVATEEALRLAEMGDLARLRLSLLILESTAEILLHREATHRLMYQEFDQRMLDRISESERAGLAATPEIEQMRRELQARVLSKTRRRKIDREFDEKIDFLVDEDAIESAHARVLKKLHDYRNEAYHRDRVRTETLVSAVKIYSYLTCLLLRDLEPHGTAYGLDIPPGLQAYAARPFDTDVQRTAAEALLARVASQPGDVAVVLADHATARLADLRGMLEEVTSFANAYRSAEDQLDVRAMIASLQIDDVCLAVWGTREQLLAAPVKVTSATLDEWDRVAGGLARVGTDIESFASFADLEDEVEPFEQLVIDAARAMDEAIDAQIDEARGK